ncbi:MAG: exodeoxyribonuclease VII large subunit [Alphaproteobacteria bacterium]|nr:exodeoxyribonuclease VII large subunit [Alphaproteobacteria bacterium]
MNDQRTNLPELSVSEISTLLKRTVEDSFSLVRVRGEISGFKRHSSGHLYFALKDSEAVLDAVCWKGSAAKLAAKPEDGLEVVCLGRLTTYAGRSKYQMVVEQMELSGEGALLKLLEERKKKLAAEGLFASERKRPIPYLPGVIGVITSPTGAVIRDILHRLADRFPRHVLVWPVAVQGEGAAQQVARAIQGFNALSPNGAVPRPDLLIVARGGGSIEDLWAFNEEIVVRAAAESQIPLISAVGHETDTTLIDFASDRRAPTPTAAAEMAVPVRMDLVADLKQKSARMAQAMGRLLDERRMRLEGLERGLPKPSHLVEEAQQKLDERAERLANAYPAYLERQRANLAKLGATLRSPRELIALKAHQLEKSATALANGWKGHVQGWESGLDRAGRLLESLSHRSVLARGYALVHGPDGGVIGSVERAKKESALQVEFHDGAVEVTVDGAAPAPQKPRKGPGDQRQGSLL